MHRAVPTRLTLLAAATLAIGACSEPTVTPESLRPRGPSLNLSGTEGPQQYVIVASSADRLPKSITADIELAGGSVLAALHKIGVVIATSDDPSFADKAARIAGVHGVEADTVVQWIGPETRGEELEVGTDEVGGESHQIGGHETFRAVQWAPDAISAPAAWAAGATGAGVRVAILDGGIHSTHIDIAPRIDAGRSASFATGAWNTDVGTFWHGTHVAGIVAAPANNIGTVGIAPDATIIGVKVLHNGTGAWGGVIAGIVYAATPIAEDGAGANIINMSLGAYYPHTGSGSAALKVAMGRATTYAYQRGVTVIASAGNEGADMDHTANWVHMPSDAPHVISVSALGPMNWAVPNAQWDLDRPASYTNYGQSAIDVAGPGGDFASPLANSVLCTKPRLPTGTVTTSCWVFDMVMAPCRGGATSVSTYCWAAGTSMSSPAVAGVAALILGRNPDMSPTDVRQRLEKSADDLGKPGNDDYYGAGRVNALKAVQ
jgi:subtilisin family serine protease